MKAEPAIHSCPYIKHIVGYSPLNFSFPESINRMQQGAPLPRRRSEILRRCPITVRPSSLPNLSTCVLTAFEKLAWLGGYHRGCFPQPGNKVLCEGRRASSSRIGQATCVHADADAACMHTCTHLARETSQEHRIYTHTHTYIHTHTYTHTHCERHHHADQLHLERPSRGAHVLAVLQVFTSELVI